MDSQILDVNPKEISRGNQDDSIGKDIRQTLCFNFPCTSIVHDIPFGFTQLHYMFGYQDLVKQFETSIGKIPFEASESVAAIVGAVDNVIEFLEIKQLVEAPKLSEYTISSAATSLDIPEEERQKLYNMLKDSDFQKQPSTYIKRRPYKWEFSISPVAPFAHILLALKLRTKREDAIKQLHSIYFWGNLSYTGSNGQHIDFSQYFNRSDYWYYEMNTGINLCVEIAAVLQELLDQKVIEKADIQCICSAIKSCLYLINPYRLLTRIHLVRNCIRFGAAYIKAVRENSDTYIIQENNLLSPIPQNKYHYFEQPIGIEISENKPRKGSKKPPQEKVTRRFTIEQLSWVFSEILHTIEIPFVSYKYPIKFNNAPQNYPIYKDKPSKHALVFCNKKHSHVSEYTYCATTYGKNTRAEKLFYTVHSILFNDKDE